MFFVIAVLQIIEIVLQYVIHFKNILLYKQYIVLYIIRTIHIIAHDKIQTA